MSNSGSLLRYVRRLATSSDSCATDRQLLDRFVSGRDGAAFRALVARHGAMVLGVCRRMLRSGDAEDAFQAAFLVLARKAGSIRRPEKLSNWLYGVAYRTALESRAKAARRRRRERELTMEPAVDAKSDIIWRDLRPVLDQEINGLPDKYRSPFVLCYLEGRTNEEAAARLGCPKGTILSRLAWARQRLQTRLARRGIALSAAGASSLFSTEALSAIVTPELVNSTSHAALLFVSGQTVAAGEAVALAKAVLKTLSVNKVKTVCVTLFAVTVLGGSLAGLGASRSAPAVRDAENPVALAQDTGLQDTLFALEKDTWEATKKKDVKHLRTLFAEDYVAILSDGSRLTLDEYCMVLPLFKIKSYSLSDVQLRPLGADATILMYKATSQTDILGEAGTETVQVCSTWTRRNGQWRNVLYQETPVTEE